jgi:hypothetical protein
VRLCRRHGNVRRALSLLCTSLYSTPTDRCSLRSATVSPITVLHARTDRKFAMNDPGLLQITKLILLSKMEPRIIVYQVHIPILPSTTPRAPHSLQRPHVWRLTYRCVGSSTPRSYVVKSTTLYGLGLMQHAARIKARKKHGDLRNLLHAYHLVWK